MFDQKYSLRYLPLFHDELESAVMYIASRLCNPSAAADLLNHVEEAIKERLDHNPEVIVTCWKFPKHKENSLRKSRNTKKTHSENPETQRKLTPKIPKHRQMTLDFFGF